MLTWLVYCRCFAGLRSLDAGQVEVHHVAEVGHRQAPEHLPVDLLRLGVGAQVAEHEAEQVPEARVRGRALAPGPRLRLAALGVERPGVVELLPVVQLARALLAGALLHAVERAQERVARLVQADVALQAGGQRADACVEEDGPGVVVVGVGERLQLQRPRVPPAEAPPRGGQGQAAGAREVRRVRRDAELAVVEHLREVEAPLGAQREVGEGLLLDGPGLKDL